jgi:hypothetical protein
LSNLRIPKRLRLAPGQSHTLELPGHGVGGYVWRADVGSGPGRIEAISPGHPPDDIGAGAAAQFLLTWLGRTPGVVTVSLKRPWEDRAIETYDIEVEPVTDIEAS